MKLDKKVVFLRVAHGLFTLFFALCLIVLFYAAISRQYGIIFWICFLCLGIEGFLVFVMNKGNCPLIHVQRKIGDNKPFFELFLPPRLAEKAIPYFAYLTLFALALLLLRLR